MGLRDSLSGAGRAMRRLLLHAMLLGAVLVAVAVVAPAVLTVAPRIRHRRHH